MKMWLFFFICMLGVLLLLLLLVFFLIVKMDYSREKYSTFECGFDVLGDLRIPFSIHFYFITIIFLIFDVEVVLLLPFIYIVKCSGVFFFVFVFFFFFLVLVGGFFYEWYFGFLNWLF
uniref:NADH-ubiquinone oxidoreductase chain 3 n=1 Tax=Trialeurodes vaporariorum TaxID=88556 RepID=Q674N4_TRIVP|nr:NADH dehydrogenase subunit 3 [Trialeurodes vaporariorum]AAU14226.1 NADH dehydrogenase subunit 3 [Trialeurodes vaporariorum]